ncbi:MAG: DUF5674 family protein [Candidatus Woesebacteria bacterium]
MIITKTEPFTTEEIRKLQESLDPYIKTVIDVRKKICCAGMKRHFEGQERLTVQGSDSKDVWGGGVDTATKAIDFSSMINIRPTQQNESHVIEDHQLQETYTVLSEYFFKAIL